MPDRFADVRVQALRPVTLAKTVWHFSMHVKEHLTSDRASHIFKHLQNSEHCHTSCSADCFRVLDHASTSFQLKIKEGAMLFESTITPCQS